MSQVKPLGQVEEWCRDRFKLLVLTLLALGIFFRFANLGQQVYWHDETHTSVWIAGHTLQEVNQLLFTGNVTSVEVLQRYQHPGPDRTLWDTVRSISIDAPAHPPFYYILLRGWVQTFGDSVTITRSLSAFLSLLVFPALYWMIRELFMAAPGEPVWAKQGQRTAMVTLALVAISPFHVLYAQEARPYALWTVIVLLLNALLLRAIRVKTRLSWALYTSMLTIGLYTHPFTGFVAIVQGVYVFITERFRCSRTVIAYLLALALGVIPFLPWLTTIVRDWSDSGATWTNIPLPLPILLKTWGLHLNRAFILTVGDFGFDHWSTYMALPVLFVLVAYSFYFLWHQTPLRIWLLVALLTGATFVPLGAADLILGGQRSSASRYLLPFYLGVPLAVAYLLASKMLSSPSVQQKLWQGVAVLLSFVSLGACILNAYSNTAWTKVVNYSLPAVAQTINEAPQPLLISTSHGINLGSLLALSYLLDADVKLQLVDDWQSPQVHAIPPISDQFSQVFLFNPSDTFRTMLKQNNGGTTELVFHDTHLFLWQWHRSLN